MSTDKQLSIVLFLITALVIPLSWIKDDTLFLAISCFGNGLALSCLLESVWSDS